MAAYSTDLTRWDKDPVPLYRAGGHPMGIDSSHAHKVTRPSPPLLSLRLPFGGIARGLPSLPFYTGQRDCPPSPFGQYKGMTRSPLCQHQSMGG